MHGMWAWARPLWLMMVVLYWVIDNPLLVNVGIAWCMGLLLDSLQGVLLGEHAFAMLVVAYLASLLRQRMWAAPFFHKTSIVLSLSWIYLLIFYCLQSFVGEPIPTVWYWIAGLSTWLVWPFVYFLLQLGNPLKRGNLVESW